MKAIVILLVGFLVIGIFARKFDARTRWLIFLLGATVVLYETIK
jgi:hypothetical protein